MSKTMNTIETCMLLTIITVVVAVIICTYDVISGLIDARKPHDVIEVTPIDWDKYNRIVAERKAYTERAERAERKAYNERKLTRL